MATNEERHEHLRRRGWVNRSTVHGGGLWWRPEWPVPTADNALLDTDEALAWQADADERERRAHLVALAAGVFGMPNHEGVIMNAGSAVEAAEKMLRALFPGFGKPRSDGEAA